MTTDEATRHPHSGATPVVDVGGESYLTDPKGALVPMELVSPTDLLMDEVVGDHMGSAKVLAEQIAAVKEASFLGIAAFRSLLEQEYGTTIGGTKGNTTLTSFDGLRQVRLQVADKLDFGPELQTAKNLVDECLIEWGGESRAELRAIVNRAFVVDQAGTVRRAELFSILRLEIEDPRWQRAMKAIRDSIRPLGTKEYVRFYERTGPGGAWQAVSLDIANA